MGIKPPPPKEKTMGIDLGTPPEPLPCFMRYLARFDNEDDTAYEMQLRKQANEFAPRTAEELALWTRFVEAALHTVGRCRPPPSAGRSASSSAGARSRRRAGRTGEVPEVLGQRSRGLPDARRRDPDDALQGVHGLRGHGQEEKEREAMSRKDEPGWVKIGATCSAGRRSLWWRVNLRPADRVYHVTVEQRATLEEAGVDPDRPFVDFKDVESIELCAGREGDDAYVKLVNDGGPQFYAMWDVLSSAEFAAGT